MIKDYKEIDFDNNRNIMVDTNVLLYVFGPESFTDHYDCSELLNKLISSNAKIYVNQAILSEFVNCSIKNRRKIYMEENDLKQLDYKGHYDTKIKQYVSGYRDKDDFRETYEHIIDDIKDNMLKLINIVSSDKESIFKSLDGCHELDLNDSQIIQDAEKNDCIIWTQDKDYKNVKENYGVTVFKKNR